jgi:hypothetical protein
MKKITFPRIRGVSGEIIFIFLFSQEIEFPGKWESLV